MNGRLLRIVLLAIILLTTGLLPVVWSGEKQDKKDIKMIAEREAKREYNQNKSCTGQIESITVTSRKDKKEKISMIKNRRDFIRMIGSKE